MIENSNLAYFIIGCIAGSGVTILLGLIVMKIIQIRNLKKKAPQTSRYYKMDQDGNKIPLYEDDGEV